MTMGEGENAPEMPAEAKAEVDATATAPKGPPSEESVIDALKRVYDPEIPVNIYDLGLIYSLEIAPDGATPVKMTLTAPGCPVAGSLVADVERRVRAVDGVSSGTVELVWEPPWRPEMMSKLARVMLGM